MSEKLKKRAKRPVLGHCRSIALLALLLATVSVPVMGEGIEAYGARMCAESGIAPEDCSFVSNPAVARQAEAVRQEELDRSADKTATLLEHGRRVCDEENVPLEDCQAIPSAFRGEPEPAAAFLTSPSVLPPVDPALVPLAPPPPTARRIVREQQPVRPIVRPVPVRTEGPAFRPPRPAAPIVRQDFPPFLPATSERRFVPPLPPPVEPVFVERRPRIVERVPAERFLREDRVIVEERFVRGERRSGRCLRAVRYSAPPSYRYVTC
ncbi:MAG: hypothetical protein AAF543_22740 [Pseudomonadota bacterium]